LIGSHSPPLWSPSPVLHIANAEHLQPAYYNEEKKSQ
jgi:hypothetical protein